MSNGLSEREQVVLSWLTRGLSNKEIGLALSISPRTVQNICNASIRSLGCKPGPKQLFESISGQGAPKA